MLKVRVASGLILAAVVAAAVVLLPLAWMAAFFHFVVLVAAYEWAKLAGIGTRPAFVAYAAGLSGVVAALWLLPAIWPLALVVAGAFWLAALVAVWTYPSSLAAFRSTPVVLAAGVFALCGAWLALVALKASTTSHGDATGGWQIIWLLAAAAAADTGAYFAGRRFGRRKLAPHVSPGKTLEGAVGGAFAIVAWGVCGALLFDGDVSQWVLIAAVLFVAAVTGDLFESALKRTRGVKDSGGILPGHGGLLDRIDSVVAVAPVFALLVR